MTNKINHFDHEITIDKVVCPMHVITIKKGLEEINVGETLKVISNTYVADELMAAARQIGSNVVLNENQELFITK